MNQELRKKLYGQARRKALKACANVRGHKNLLMMSRYKLLDARYNYYQYDAGMTHAKKMQAAVRELDELFGRGKVG